MKVTINSLTTALSSKESLEGLLTVLKLDTTSTALGTVATDLVKDDDAAELETYGLTIQAGDMELHYVNNDNLKTAMSLLTRNLVLLLTEVTFPANVSSTAINLYHKIEDYLTGVKTIKSVESSQLLGDFNIQGKCNNIEVLNLSGTLTNDIIGLNSTKLNLYSVKYHNPKGITINSCPLLKISYLGPVLNYTSMDAFANTGFYHTNGLVLMLDTSYGLTTTEWKDAVNNTTFSGTITLSSGVPTFEGTAITCSTTPEFTSSSYTLEVVYLVTTTQNSCYPFRYNINNSPAYRILSNGSISIGNVLANTTGSLTYDHTQFTTASFVVNEDSRKAIINLVTQLITFDLPGAGLNSATFSVGTGFYGKIYSIRVYNRALSDSEIKENQLIDKARWL